ncbi:MAG TPA: hypothetical protein VFS56_10775 [Gemmatimonadaceae bacterium]|nr:hypothetical protein [Gemmatimonadaceae bacterium]
MKLQRWVGLIGAAVMLHTNAKAAFAGCVLADSGATAAVPAQSHPASHGERVPGADPESTHHHDEGSAPEEMAGASGDEGVPSDPSGSEDCCREMTSCGSNVILNQGAPRTAKGLAAAAAFSRHSEALLGRTAEPEPPPPKG